MNPDPVQHLLERLQAGDPAAGEELFEIVYGDLHSRARRLLADSAPHTLQATALVHEAWLKLHGNEGAARNANDRAHFVAVAAKAMRSVLVDHARGKQALKRGGGNARVILDEALAVYTSRVPDVIELHEELDKLQDLDERLARVVELRFFGGLSIAEAASVLGIGHATVERDWQAARAYLAGRLGAGDDARP